MLKSPPRPSGGGGNRGGAFNLFTAGGFFSPGGRANLFGRLRILFLFFCWSACMYTIISSVLRLMRYAVSGITIPKWSHDERGGKRETGETALASASEEEGESVLEEAGASTRAAPSAREAEAAPEAATASGAGAPSSSLRGGATNGMLTGQQGAGGLSDMAIEAGSVDEQQRAYLDLLQRHSAAARAAGEGGTGGRSLAAQSTGLYFMILGCVAFFVFAS